jgi:hypothetical protein
MTQEADSAWRRALLDAANYLEAYGWEHGCGPSDIVSALAIVCVHSVPYIHVINELERLIGMRLMEWNNEPNLTKYEVIAKLRECAISPYNLRS